MSDKKTKDYEKLYWKELEENIELQEENDQLKWKIHRLERKIKSLENMEKVYEKLLKDISKMTPEQKKEEWEDLKHFNDVGPTVEEYLNIIKKN